MVSSASGRALRIAFRTRSSATRTGLGCASRYSSTGGIIGNSAVVASIIRLNEENTLGSFRSRENCAGEGHSGDAAVRVCGNCRGRVAGPGEGPGDRGAEGLRIV